MSCTLKFFPKIGEARRRHREYTQTVLQRRLATKGEKNDFLSYIDERGLTGTEINVNAQLLVLAGSETTASLLSGATYYLLKNKVALDKVCDEVRSTFQNEDNITFTSVGRLPYLNAVIEEGLRLYPPVPSAFPRRTLPEGNVIDGHFVPGKYHSRSQPICRLSIQGQLPRSRKLHSRALAWRSPLRRRPESGTSAIPPRPTQLHWEESGVRGDA